jgi:hypothetical protein
MTTAMRENPNLWVHAQEPSEWCGRSKTHPAQSTGPEGKKNSGDGENFSLDFSFYRTSPITFTWYYGKT